MTGSLRCAGYTVTTTRKSPYPARNSMPTFAKLKYKLSHTRDIGSMSICLFKSHLPEGRVYTACCSTCNLRHLSSNPRMCCRW